MKYLLTLQGPTADGNLLMESWEIAEEVYMHMRPHFGEPIATTLTDPNAKVISQRFAGDDS